jgi:hypothetical protein
MRENNLKKINFSPYSEMAILNQLTEAELNIRIQTDVPIVSKEIVEYTVVSTTGHLSALSGFVHLESRADGTLSFTSDKGANVVLKTEVNAIHWILDRKKAIENSKKDGALYTLILEVESEDITANLSNNKQYNSQRSVNILLRASLIDLKTQQSIINYQNDITKMNAVVSSAIKEAAEYLASQLAEKIKKQLK